MGTHGGVLMCCLLTLDIGGLIKDLFKGRQLSIPVIPFYKFIQQNTFFFFKWKKEKFALFFWEKKLNFIK